MEQNVSNHASTPDAKNDDMSFGEVTVGSIQKGVSSTLTRRGYGRQKDPLTTAIAYRIKQLGNTDESFLIAIPSKQTAAMQARVYKAARGIASVITRVRTNERHGESGVRVWLKNKRFILTSVKEAADQ